LKQFLWRSAAGALLLALACNLAGAQPALQAERIVAPELVRLPLVIQGKTIDVVGHLYKPAGDGPFPLVIFSHGRAPYAVDRAKFATPVLPGHANVWLRKGAAVLAPIRPGYGESGGYDRESTGARWSEGRCTASPDFTGSANQAREAIEATYRWAQEQPWVRRDRILLVGESVGGLATVATGALNLPGVVGMVNFVGGAGGNPAGSPGQSCMPAKLTETWRAYGALAKAPSLWLYAPNDLFWGEQFPRDWHAAYAEGGSPTQFVQTAPLEGQDGHRLLAYGGRMWSVPLNAFVNRIGLFAP
jgi:dienelactone hydrolase